MLRAVILCLLTSSLAGRRHAGDQAPPNLRLDLSPGQVAQLQALKPGVFYYACFGNTINSAALASDGFVTLVPASALFDEKLDCNEESQRWNDESLLGMEYIPAIDESRRIQHSHLEPDTKTDDSDQAPPLSANTWSSIMCEVSLQILFNRLTEFGMGLIILTNFGQRSKCTRNFSKIKIFWPHCERTQ